MNKIMKIALCIVLIYLMYPWRPLEAQDTEIDSLNAQKSIIDSLINVRESEIEQLYLIEEQLSLTIRLIKKLEQKQKSTALRLSSTSNSITNNQNRLEELRIGLASNLKNFYINYKPAPAALFAAKSFQDAARQLHYFKVTSNFLRNQIDSIDQIKSNLERSKIELKRINMETAELVKRKNFEESLLEMRKSEKSRILAKIEDDVNLRKQYIEELRRNNENLAELTSQLESKLSSVDFINLKGKLPRPASGNIIKHFGKDYDRYTNTETFFPGIAIRKKSGSEITAVADGKVAHTEYLRGYGNLVIVDHGDGWYTLYGHLSQVEVAKGQEVRQGKIIGLSGETGTNLGPSLFFGIRQRDTSFDPVEWFKQ